MIKISDIVPYENNPRKNDRAVEVVEKSIKEFGFLVPVILDKKNVIVAGHTRIKAALRLKLSEVPVIYAENLSPAQVKAFRIMDNKSVEFADWDPQLLKLEFEKLDDLEYNTELTGFTAAEIGEIFDKDLDSSQKVDHLGKLLVTCPRCKHKFSKRDGKKNSS